MNSKAQYTNMRLTASQYDIGAIEWMAPLLSGSSSGAWRIESKKGSFILRRCRSVMAAADEYAISEVMLGCDFIPEILLTKDGERFAMGEDGFYNLQTRFEGEPLSEINENTISEAAVILVTLHQKLRAARLHLHGFDRFALFDRSYEEIIKLSEYPDAWPLFKRINEFCEPESIREDCIHGDAGIWNFLSGKGSLRLIDFGEARMGSVFTDHAGFLVSALEKTEEETAAQYLRQYLDVCAEQGSPLDPAALHTYIDHWLLKGLYVSLSYGNPERTIRRTMDIYDQFIRLFKAL